MNKKDVVKKDVVKKDVLTSAVIDSEKKFYLDKYLNKGSVAYEKSCARKITELLSIKECTLNELVLFAQNFYDTLENNIEIDKRKIWLTGRKQIDSNGNVKKDMPQSTLNKHIQWLWKAQAICVKRNGANYFIDMM